MKLMMTSKLYQSGTSAKCGPRSPTTASSQPPLPALLSRSTDHRISPPDQAANRNYAHRKATWAYGFVSLPFHIRRVAQRSSCHIHRLQVSEPRSPAPNLPHLNRIRHCQRDPRHLPHHCLRSSQLSQPALHIRWARQAHEGATATVMAGVMERLAMVGSQRSSRDQSRAEIKLGRCSLPLSLRRPHLQPASRLHR